MAWRARTRSGPGTTRSPCRSASSRARSGGPADSSEVCGTSHIRPSTRPSGRRTSRMRPLSSTSAAATRHVDGRAAAGVAPEARRRALGRARRTGCGQGSLSHAGLRGRQTVAPSSISAWFQSPGLLVVEQLRGALVPGGARRGTPRRAGRRAGPARGARCRRLRQRQAVGYRQHGARRVEADAGHARARPRGSAGTRPRDARRGGGPHGAGCGRAGSSRGRTRRRAPAPRRRRASAATSGSAPTNAS